MTEYKCPKCGEVYKSSINYQKLFCLKCNTEIPLIEAWLKQSTGCNDADLEAIKSDFKTVIDFKNLV